MFFFDLTKSSKKVHFNEKIIFALIFFEANTNAPQKK